VMQRLTELRRLFPPPQVLRVIPRHDATFMIRGRAA
jgi:hypothetical protein